MILNHIKLWSVYALSLREKAQEIVISGRGGSSFGRGLIKYRDERPKQAESRRYGSVEIDLFVPSIHEHFKRKDN